MTDKFLGVGGIHLENDDDLIGEALGIRVDKNGNLRTVDKPLNSRDLLAAPLELNKGERKVINIYSGAKSATFLGLTDISNVNIDIAFSNLIDNSSLPYKFEKHKINNNRFEAGPFISKSDNIRLTIRNESNETVVIEKLIITENVEVLNIGRNIERIYTRNLEVNDLFTFENGLPSQSRLRYFDGFITDKYKRFLMYIDSNYDVSFSVDVYENLIDDIATGTAFFDGEKFLIGPSNVKNNVEIPKINESNNLISRYRFPIHDAVDTLKNRIENMGVRIEAKSITKVDIDNFDDLKFKMTIIGVM